MCPQVGGGGERLASHGVGSVTTSIQFSIASGSENFVKITLVIWAHNRRPYIGFLVWLVSDGVLYMEGGVRNRSGVFGRA